MSIFDDVIIPSMKFTRPISDEELQLLRQEDEVSAQQIKRLTKWALIAVLLIVTASIVIYGYIAAKLLPVLGLTSSGLLLAMLWAMVSLIRDIRKNMNGRDQLRAKNTLAVIRAVTQAYIYFPEQEDEGDGYIFQLEDNRLLAISGQDFYKDEKWPTTCFEIIEGKDDKGRIIFFAVVTEGEPLAPAHVVENTGGWFNLAHPELPDPVRFSETNGTLEDCLKVIRNNKGKHNIE